MYAVSNAFRTALEAGNPQRIFMVYANGTIMTNEHIAVDAGVSLHETWCDDVDVTIGNTASSEINFVVFNDNSEWTDFAFGRFKAYIGVEVSITDSEIEMLTVSVNDSALTATVDVEGVQYSYELMPLGVFVGTRPNVVDSDEITVSSNDLMTLFDEDMPSRSALGLGSTSPITAGVLLQKMCEYLNVTAVSYTFLNSTASISEWPETFENSTMRDVLSWIAELACANALFNRDGKLELRWFKTVNKSYDESQYLNHTPYWYDVPAVGSIHVRQTDADGEDVAGSGTNAYLIQDNPFVEVSGT